MPRRESVPLRDYVDQGLAGLARYYDTVAGGTQAQIDRRISEMQRETEGRFREQAAALTAAAVALDKRLDAMNEFREQIRDVTARKVDTELYRQAADASNVRLEAIESVLDRQRGRVSAFAAFGTVLIVAVTVLTLILSHVRG